SLRRPSGEPPKVTVRVKACCLTSTSGRTLQALTILPTRPIRAMSWSYSSSSAPVASASEMVRIQVTALPLGLSVLLGDHVEDVAKLTSRLVRRLAPGLAAIDRGDVRDEGAIVVWPDYDRIGVECSRHHR